MNKFWFLLSEAIDCKKCPFFIICQNNKNESYSCAELLSDNIKKVIEEDGYYEKIV